MAIWWIQEDNPYHNLALETLLFKGGGGPDLLLWQNRPSVFIGRNQSPWQELELQHIYLKGVPIVRRLSGGGAVYHDKGNLNLSFMDSANKSAHFSLLEKTFSHYNLPIRVGDRGEITANGFKVSGSAYYLYMGRRLHHMTMLFNSDLGALWHYLKRRPEALTTRAVQSVRQAVGNLNDLCEALSLDDFVNTLQDHYTEGKHKLSFLDLESNFEISKDGLLRLTIEEALSRASISKQDFEAQVRHLMSWDWIFGHSPEFIKTVNYLGRRITLQVSGGLLKDIAIEGDLPELLQDQMYQRLSMPYIEEQWFM